MSFLSRLVGSKGTAQGPKDIDAALKRLEGEAERAAPGYVGTSYNKAGDLALKAGQSDRALGYYGRAIDAFLEDMQREAARGVANKIIRVRPTAVRTLCTLTWLDLAARHQATALLHLRDYVAGAKEAGQNARAATQIYEMAKLSSDAEFVDAVADSLDSLDFSNRAEEVRVWTAEGSPNAIEDSNELSDACLRAAVRSNDRNAPMLDEDVAGEAEASAAEHDGPDDGDPTDEVETSTEADADDASEDAEAADAVAADEEDALDGDEDTPDDEDAPGDDGDDEREDGQQESTSGDRKAGKSRKSRKKRKKKR